MMEIEKYVHTIGISLSIVCIFGYLIYRYFKKRKKNNGTY